MADNNQKPNPKPEGEEEHVGLFKRMGRGIKSTCHRIKDNPVVMAIGTVLGAGLGVAGTLAVSALTGRSGDEDDEEEATETAVEDDDD